MIGLGIAPISKLQIAGYAIDIGITVEKPAHLAIWVPATIDFPCPPSKGWYVVHIALSVPSA